MIRYLPQHILNIEQSNADTTVRKFILPTIIITEGHENSQLVLQRITIFSIALVSVCSPSATFVHLYRYTKFCENRSFCQVNEYPICVNK